MSAKYRLPFGQKWPTQQSHGLFATAKLLVQLSRSLGHIRFWQEVSLFNTLVSGPINNIKNFLKFPYVVEYGLAFQIGNCSSIGCNNTYGVYNFHDYQHVFCFVASWKTVHCVMRCLLMLTSTNCSRHITRCYVTSRTSWRHLTPFVGVQDVLHRGLMTTFSCIWVFLSTARR